MRKVSQEIRAKSEGSTLVRLLCTQALADSYPGRFPAIRVIRDKCTGDLARVGGTTGG